MTRSDLVARVALRHGITRLAARRVVDAVLGGIADALCTGHRVELRGLGSLRPRHYEGYAARNPRTGDRVVVPRKVLPVFRPARGLIRRLEPGAVAGRMPAREER